MILILIITCTFSAGFVAGAIYSSANKMLKKRGN